MYLLRSKVGVFQVKMSQKLGFKVKIQVLKKVKICIVNE